MRGLPDPTIPREPYDPDKPNPGVEELKRQQAAGEPLDPGKSIAILEKSWGNVFEDGDWVRNEPYSQRTWEGDGA